MHSTGTAYEYGILIFSWTTSPFMFKRWNVWSVCHHIACLVVKLDCLLIRENKIKWMNLRFKKCFSQQFLFLFMLNMLILNVAARLWWDLSEVNRYGPSSYKQTCFALLPFSGWNYHMLQIHPIYFLWVFILCFLIQP